MSSKSKSKSATPTSLAEGGFTPINRPTGSRSSVRIQEKDAKAAKGAKGAAKKTPFPKAPPKGTSKGTPKGTTPEKKTPPEEDDGDDEDEEEEDTPPPPKGPTGGKTKWPGQQTGEPKKQKPTQKGGKKKPPPPPPPEEGEEDEDEEETPPPPRGPTGGKTKWPGQKPEPKKTRTTQKAGQKRKKSGGDDDDDKPDKKKPKVKAPKKDKSPVIKETTLQFLRDLRDNNDRDWLNDDVNKKAQKDAEQNWQNFVAALTPKLIGKDGTVKKVTPKFAITSIEKDKRNKKAQTDPFKPFFTAQWSSSGKNGHHAKYHIQLQPDNQTKIEVGVQAPKGDQLAVIRENLDKKRQRIQDVLLNQEIRNRCLGVAARNRKQVFDAYDRYQGTGTDARVKTSPKGYNSKNPMIQLIRLKRHTTGLFVRDISIVKSNATDSVANIFEIMMPFVNWLNGVIEGNADNEGDGGDDGADGEGEEDEENGEDGIDEEDDEGKGKKQTPTKKGTTKKEPAKKTTKTTAKKVTKKEPKKPKKISSKVTTKAKQPEVEVADTDDQDDADGDEKKAGGVPELSTDDENTDDL
ncbi:MAG: hypothetical protein MMC33_005802 [Icmadophila ericetorum]|nr:hypothetical protein [Icmadophila ericetorum]